MSTVEVKNPGCVILLIDESAAMGSTVQEASPAGSAAGGPPSATPAKRSKAEAVSTALNALLKQLTDGPDFDLALVGYQTDSADEAFVTSRWGGSLSGQDFVSTQALAAAPVKVETRMRKTPNPAGFGPPLEQPFEFPIWYVPELGKGAPQIKAFQHCQQLISNWQENAGPNPGVPLVLHIFGGGSGDGNPQKAISELIGMELPVGSPLLFQAHLSISPTVPATLYPSNKAYLPVGATRDLFDRCSLLQPVHVDALKAAKVIPNPNARGMLYNAKMVDIVRLLSLVKAHVKDWPPRSSGIEAEPEPELETVSSDFASDPLSIPLSSDDPAATESSATSDTVIADAGGFDLPEGDLTFDLADGTDVPLEDLPPEGAPSSELTEKRGLIVFVLDRSAEDPYSGDPKSAWSRLRDSANELLTQIGKKGDGKFDTALISYGVDLTGDADVRTTFDGPLVGQSIVADTDLIAGAIRVDEFEQDVPNGVGGLMKVPMKKPIFVELDPTSAATPHDAFAAVRDLLQTWCGDHSLSCVPPTVLHLTRGKHSAGDMATAAAVLQEVTPAAGPVLLYHLIATEEPHRSISYATATESLDDADLAEPLSVTSPLLNNAALSARKSFLQADSLGFVVNGKFDLLLDSVAESLST